MKSTQKFKGIRWGLISLMVLLLMAIPNPASAQEEIGNFCVQDYQSGAVCTANDVRIEEMEFVNLIEACNQGTIGMLTAEFRMMVSAAGSPDRYDIGVFVDLSGESAGALTGDSCYHDYLSPPITETVTYGDLNNDGIADIVAGPWWNGEPSDLADTCGDLATNTQAFSYLVPLTLPCVDNNNNGAVDVHVCASWDNNSNTTCEDVQGAFPGTNSKCSCNTIDLPFNPTKIGLIELTANSSNFENYFALILAAITGLGLLVVPSLIRKARREQARN